MIQNANMKKYNADTMMKKKDIWHLELNIQSSIKIEQLVS